MIVEWGDFPGWLEALATVGAFGAVAWPLWQANGDRHREQATQIDYCLWGQEQQVHWPVLIRPGDPMPERKMPVFALGTQPKKFSEVYLTLLNSSTNSIHEVTIYAPMFPQGDKLRIGKVPPGFHSRRLTDLRPDLQDQDVEFDLGLYMPFMQFIDKDNRAWQRDAAGALEQITRKRARI
jgi:hypothetical protein